MNTQRFAVKVTHSLTSDGNPDHAEHFFDNKTIEDTTDYEVGDYYYLTADEAKQRLSEAEAFIKKCENELGWIPGKVTAWIDECNKEIEDEYTAEVITKTH